MLLYKYNDPRFPEVTRREIKQGRKLEEQNTKIADGIVRRVLGEVMEVGQEINPTSRWGRGTITDRSLEIAHEALSDKGIHTHLEQRQDVIDNYEHTQEQGDQPLTYPVFIVDELDDTKRTSRRRDKR